MDAVRIERRFARGAVIAEQGQPAREMFVVRQGSVALWRNDTDPPRLLGRGEMFGEVATILGRPFDFRAAAEQDAELLAIDLPLLNQLVAHCPEFAMRLALQLAVQADGEPAEHTSPGIAPAANPAAAVLPAAEPSGAHERLRAEQRLIAALLARCGDEEPPLVVPAGLKDLAAAAGIALIDAYHGLQSLVDRRLVRVIDDQLSVVDPEELKQLAG
jgi:CRP-like cAMP-binding protein